MRCERVQTQLANDLGAAQRSARVAEHLAGCAACRAEAARLNAVVAAVERLPMPQVPADLRARTFAAIAERRQATHRAGPVWLRRPAFAALAAGIAAVAFFAGRPSPSPMLQVEAGSLYSSPYAASHALVSAGSPLADSAALHAMGALAEREERHP
ncbi:MAG: hypothetical protein HZB16_22375 [Armatimonadetes bacterium]|nr:hypothetical protein [Armatimonadota bacterium]